MNSIAFRKPYQRFQGKANCHQPNTAYNRLQPAANILKNDQGLSLQLAVPGISKEEVTIRLEKQYLIIEAGRIKEPAAQPDRNYTLKQFDYRHFRRTFELSDAIDRDSIQAEYRDGILDIRMNWIPEKAQSNKKIDIL